MDDNNDRMVDEVKRNFKQDAFPLKLGVRLVELNPGFSKVEMKVTREMLNLHGIAHGGAIFTLADTAFGLASNTRGPAVALQVSINYIRSVNPDTMVYAMAEEEELTRKTGISNITVQTAEGKAVALLRGTVYRKEND